MIPSLVLDNQHKITATARAVLCGRPVAWHNQVRRVTIPKTRMSKRLIKTVKPEETKENGVHQHRRQQIVDLPCTTSPMRRTPRLMIRLRSTPMVRYHSGLRAAAFQSLGALGASRTRGAVGDSVVSAAGRRWSSTEVASDQVGSSGVCCCSCACEVRKGSFFFSV